MGKYRFSQEKRVITWVRDYYTIEAESLEEARELIEKSGMRLDEMEAESSIVKFEERDDDNSLLWMLDAHDAEKYCITCCATGDEIVSNF